MPLLSLMVSDKHAMIPKTWVSKNDPPKDEHVSSLADPTFVFASSSPSPAAFKSSDAMSTGSALTSSEKFTLTKSEDMALSAVMTVASASLDDLIIMYARIADILV
ncbi:MAG: hypothetical protein Q9177_001234 [Variospora cf. flavescens]